MIESTKLDRLVPRYKPYQDLHIGWDVKFSRPAPTFRKIAKSAPGIIVDLSLQGGLIAVSGPAEKVIGDNVVVSFNEQYGDAIVRHVRELDEHVRYGVQWAGPLDFVQTIHFAVAEARGDFDGRLQAMWEGRSRR
jgi:hypothetical protein